MAKEFLFSYEDELNWSLIHVETVVPADAPPHVPGVAGTIQDIVRRHYR